MAQLTGDGHRAWGSGLLSRIRGGPLASADAGPRAAAADLQLPLSRHVSGGAEVKDQPPAVADDGAGSSTAPPTLADSKVAEASPAAPAPAPAPSSGGLKPNRLLSLVWPRGSSGAAAPASDAPAAAAPAQEAAGGDAAEPDRATAAAKAAKQAAEAAAKGEAERVVRQVAENLGQELEAARDAAAQVECENRALVEALVAIKMELADIQGDWAVDGAAGCLLVA